MRSEVASKTKHRPTSSSWPTSASSCQHGRAAKQLAKRFVYTLGTRAYQDGYWTRGKDLFFRNPYLDDPKICIDATEWFGSDYEQSPDHESRDGRSEETQRQLQQNPRFLDCANKVQSLLLDPDGPVVLLVKCDWGKRCSVGVVHFALSNMRNMESFNGVAIETCHIELETNRTKRDQAFEWLQKYRAL